MGASNWTLPAVLVVLLALVAPRLALGQSRSSLDIPGSCPDPALCKSAGLKIRSTNTQTSRDKNGSTTTTTNPGLAAQLLTTTRRTGRRLVHTVWLQYYCKAPRPHSVHPHAQYIEVTLLRGHVLRITQQWH